MSGSVPQGAGYLGPASTNTSGSPINAQTFLIQQIAGRMATTTIVKIVAVHGDGGLAPVGTVDVLPLVNQIDGYGQGTPHGTIFGVPYFRLQGGANAVIIDPKVGDLGIALFCSRDISNVKATKKQANPGSRRRFDWADALYIGGILNGIPSQYVAFGETSITLTATEEVIINAPVKVTVNSPLIETSGAVEATGQVTALKGASQVSVTTHTHSGGAPPTPGT